jgi:3-phytase
MRCKETILGACAVMAVIAAAMWWTGSYVAVPFDGPVVSPQARVATMPVGTVDADDPAIWIHPADPALSLVLGTDKRGGLHVYNLDGTERQLVATGSRPNNVDVVYDFPLDGERVDLAVAGVRFTERPGVQVWRIDPDDRLLTNITSGGVVSVFGGGSPAGTCAYRSPETGEFYFFVTYAGGVEQWRLREEASGLVGAERVRHFRVSSHAEGCVADEELGFFYLSEEKVGIWKFDAEPYGSTQGKLIVRVGEYGLTADVEGLAIYYATDGRGYLIASSQGNDTLKVFQRQGDHRFVLTIDPRPGVVSDIRETDGIAVSSVAMGDLFPSGMLVAHDGGGARGGKAFKFFAWEDIAGTALLIDTAWCPRRAGQQLAGSSGTSLGQ